MIGKLARVPLRQVWKHEAHDFTTWLENNIDILNDTLDLSLQGAEREKGAGSFSVDLVAEDESGNPVVIENQLKKSDHEHLGKVITYLTAIGAKTAIWIVANPRPEHINAISWLNEAADADFYLVKVEAVKIGNSPPAPLLTPIVGPSEEGKVVGKQKQELAERHKLRLRFWTQLLEKAKKRTKLHVNISPSRQYWVGTGAGKSGLAFNYVARKNSSLVELYIDTGDKVKNKAIFGKLAESKKAIEKAFGGPLTWERLDTRRACRIKKETKQGGYRDTENKWPKIHDTLIDSMVRFAKALKPHIARLKD